MTSWNAARIKELRTGMGESQEEFAKHFRLTVDSVRVWEQGRGLPGGPSTVILDQLAELLAAASGNGRKHKHAANGA